MQKEAALALDLTPRDQAVTRCSALLQLGVVQLMSEDGSIDLAVDLLEETVLLAKQSKNLNIEFISGGYLGFAFLLQENVSGAFAILNETVANAAGRGLENSPLLSYVHLGLAHLSFLGGNLLGAKQEIARAVEESRFFNDPTGLIRCHMLLALVEHTAGNVDGIKAALLKVEEAANAIQNRDLPQQIEFLSQMLIQLEPTSAQLKAVRYITAGSSLAFAKRAAKLESAQTLVSPLTERELEILSLLSEGLKQREIGEKLFISINTVFYHIKNIYGKLGVNNRTRAIAKARELQLI